jgi:hypothetical protein
LPNARSVRRQSDACGSLPGGFGTNAPAEAEAVEGRESPRSGYLVVVFSNLQVSRPARPQRGGRAGFSLRTPQDVSDRLSRGRVKEARVAWRIADCKRGHDAATHACRATPRGKVCDKPTFPRAVLPLWQVARKRTFARVLSAHPLHFQSSAFAEAYAVRDAVLLRSTRPRGACAPGGSLGKCESCLAEGLACKCCVRVDASRPRGTPEFWT